MKLSILKFKRFFKAKLLFGLFVCFICIVIYILYFSTMKENASMSKKQTISQPHVLCVLVPYRNRFEELLEFIPHMSQFLNRQSIVHHIAVINHLSDGYRFNRGSTLNAGFQIVSKKFPECDYIALNDVDTLPLNDEIPYSYPGKVAFHAIPPGFHPVRIYSTADYISGILLMTKEQFEQVNGFGNNFWGWGYEDHDLYLRLEKHSIPIKRPAKLSTDETNSFKHTHKKSSLRDVLGCRRDQIAAAKGRDQTDHTGLSDVNYTISSENTLTIDGYTFSLFNINIQCNFKITPWCKPFCKENITMPKTVWDWDETDVQQSRQKAQKKLNLNKAHSSWSRIMN